MSSHNVGFWQLIMHLLPTALFTFASKAQFKTNTLVQTAFVPLKIDKDWRQARFNYQ